MRNYYQLLMKNPLFKGIPEEKMEPVLQCLKAKKKVFTSRTLLFSSDEPIPCLGLVLSGHAEIFLTDPDGNCTLITQALHRRAVRPRPGCGPRVRQYF